MASSHLILILDSSGSMWSQKNDTVGGVNEMIRQQREILCKHNDEIIFEIVKFSCTVDFAKSAPLVSIPFMTDSDYTPSGSTALYDAIGSTIDKYKEEENVVVVVVTDGMENNSSKYNHKQITDMVNVCTTERNWKFIYLSENIDTYEQGNNIGISNNTSGCGNTAIGPEALGLCMATGSCNTAVGMAALEGIVDMTNVGFELNNLKKGTTS